MPKDLRKAEFNKSLSQELTAQVQMKALIPMLIGHKTSLGSQDLPY